MKSFFYIFKKFKSKKSKLLSYSAGVIASLLAFSTTATFTNNHHGIYKESSSLNALNTGGSATTQTKASFTIDNAQASLNKTADEVNNEELEAILTPSTTIQSFTVIILPITQTNLSQGYINFLISQIYLDSNGENKTVYADATLSLNADGTTYQSSDTLDLTYYSNSELTATSNNVFSTANITNLNGWIKTQKYSLTWKSSDEIKSYITSSSNTNLTSSEIWNNFLDSSTLPPLSDTSTSSEYTSIDVTGVDANGNTDTTNSIGLYKAEIVFHNVTSDSWSTGYPSEGTVSANGDGTDDITITKYFGGFLNSSGNRITTTLSYQSEIRTWVVSDYTLFDGATSNYQTLSTLLPSQISSPLGGSSVLISLFANGYGVLPSRTSTSTTPIINYSFNGKTFNFYDANNYASTDSTITGGVWKEIVENYSNIKINSIQPIPNDSTGSLQFVINYNGFSIYTGTIEEQTFVISYPDNSFATSETAGQNLLLSWKEESVLSQYGINTTYDVVNEFNKNKDNEEFVRVFTNQFLNTTSDVEALNRTATILYGAPSDSAPEDPVDESGTVLSETTGSYTAGANVDSTKFTVRLTFDNWNNTSESKSFQKSYSLDTYQYTGTNGDTSDVLNITWYSNSDVLANNPTFANQIPSDLVYSLINSSTTSSNYQTYFYSITTGYTNIYTSFLPDDENGSITVFVYKSSNSDNDPNAHIYSQVYTGFKKSSTTTGVISFDWIPQDDISEELLSIPLTSVTKNDVYNYYLINMDLFADGTLTLENVSISPDIETLSLVVYVTIPIYNQENIDTTVSERTFSTTISGFFTAYYTDNSAFAPEKNLTAVISISLAVLLSVTLGVVLFTLLLRRARIRNLNKYHKEILNESPPQKSKKSKHKKTEI